MLSLLLPALASWVSCRKKGSCVRPTTTGHLQAAGKRQHKCRERLSARTPAVTQLASINTAGWRQGSVSRTMHHVSRTMYHTSRISYVSRIIHHESRIMYHTSRITCHVSYVTYHVQNSTSHVLYIACHASDIRYHTSCIKCYVS